jgi:hypothetical protein
VTNRTGKARAPRKDLEMDKSVINENGQQIVVSNEYTAQGDLNLYKIDRLPPTAKEVQSGGRIVLAHSETGHHHAIDAHGRDVVMLRCEQEPLICYLQVNSDYADVVHHRVDDRHATHRLMRGLWAAGRQVEYQPDGYRMVID